jgi:hypothetical protein
VACSKDENPVGGGNFPSVPIGSNPVNFSAAFRVFSAEVNSTHAVYYDEGEDGEGPLTLVKAYYVGDARLAGDSAAHLGHVWRRRGGSRGYQSYPHARTSACPPGAQPLHCTTHLPAPPPSVVPVASPPAHLAPLPPPPPSRPQTSSSRLRTWPWARAGPKGRAAGRTRRPWAWPATHEVDYVRVYGPGPAAARPAVMAGFCADVCLGRTAGWTGFG